MRPSPRPRPQAGDSRVPGRSRPGPADPRTAARRAARVRRPGAAGRRPWPRTPSRGERHQQAAGGVIEQGRADRAAPPPGGERLFLLMPDDDEVALDLGGEPADLLDWLADREVTRHREAALLERRQALVEDALHALLLLLD